MTSWAILRPKTDLGSSTIWSRDMLAFVEEEIFVQVDEDGSLRTK